MPEVVKNTLYVSDPGYSLHQDHETVRIKEGRETILQVPLHHLRAIALLSPSYLSPPLLAQCLVRGISVSYMNGRGRFLARLEGSRSGNVMLRRAQFRAADDAAFKLLLGARFIAGKILNTRLNLVRAARQSASERPHDMTLKEAARSMGEIVPMLQHAATMNELRGLEGQAARSYFAAFNACITKQKDSFSFDRRTRRPPRSRVNAVLSFIYALLTNDCVSACQAVGLDAFVGFLHESRSGRPSLALDLVEEFRGFGDRVALALINRRQLQEESIIERPGGAYDLTDSARKTLLATYQRKKALIISHPALGIRCRIGELPIYQAQLLARTIRGEGEYEPFLWK
ncbi:MAG: type I-C CRISPR-associated endonuclease Cas1 [Leptospiraceae bacterium]|nr:type I-C CRISPR-associated endonuclease Cas1 [Leptospiraceae bacterium]